MEYKKQHFIGEAYLRAWRDLDTPNGAFVWVSDKSGGNIRRASPRRLFVESDFYTVFENGARILEVEERLNEIETIFGKLIQRIQRRETLSAQDRRVVALFASSLYCRTAFQKRNQIEIWDELIRAADKLPQTLVKQVQQSPEYKAMRQLREQPMPMYLYIFINLASPVLFLKNCAIFETTESPGFLTSDNPCLWMDGAGVRTGVPSPHFALSSEELEVIFPISPRQCISLKTRGHDGYLNIDSKTGTLDAINSMLVGNADKLVVSDKRTVSQEWFPAKRSDVH